MMHTKKDAIFLIGMPTSGKSTFIRSMGWDRDPRFYIHSTDDIVQAIAQRQGITYDDFMADRNRFFPQVIRPLLANFEQAKAQGKNIIVDMVNGTREARGHTLQGLDPNQYNIVAYVFEHDKWLRQDPVFLEQIKYAVSDRHASTGKSVPEPVLDRMFETYEPPTASEGFLNIQYVDSRNPLLNIMSR